MQRARRGVAALGLLEGVFNWAIRLSALVLIVITGYYIYGTVAASEQLFRGMAQPGQPMSAQDFQRHMGNMQFLTQVLILSGLVLVVSLIGRYPNHAESGMVLLLVGAAFFIGIPFLIDNQGGPVAGLPKALARFGNPRDYLKSQFVFSGMAVGGAGILDLIVHAILFGAQYRTRRPKPTEENARTAATVRKSNDKFLGMCWDLPFCRDTEKKLCPVRHSKKPCWRTGRGCYCDQNIILTLSGGGLASRGSAGYLSRGATIARPKSLSEKRAQCLGCPVYLHHQGQKYRVMSPAAVIGVIGAGAFYWGSLKNVYPGAMEWMGRSLSGFSFGKTASGVPVWAEDLARNQGIMWLLLLVGGILLIAYLLQGVEWLLYRLGV